MLDHIRSSIFNLLKYIFIKKNNLVPFGVKKTKEHAKHISEGRKGIIFTDEHKKNISKGKKGNVVNLTEKGKAKLSKTALKLNKQKIKCFICGRTFNPGNYGRHMKTTHKDIY